MRRIVMKIEMKLKSDLSWVAIITPETETEKTIVSAMSVGVGVKVEVYSQDNGSIKILGEGNRYVKTLPSQDATNEP
jgi:hypothetical protein